MKNKALTTLMATALTASIVLPGTTASAALNDLSSNQSNYTTVQTAGKVASSEEVIPSGEVSLTISSFSGNTVRTSKGQVTIINSLKPIFQTANRQALTNAKATVIVENGQMTDIKALTLSKMGTSKKPVVFDGGNAKISGNVTVSADYNQIKNLTISKELIVTARVKKAVTIESVSVGDTITFQPLRLKKINWLNITLKDMVTPEINVQRNKINLDSDKLISIIQVTDDVPFLKVGGDVGKLIVDVKKDFSLSGEGNIEQATVKGGTNVALDSSHHIAKVQVDDKNAKVTYAVVDKSALTALIASIQYVPVSNNVNYNITSEKWTTQAERTAIESAANSAQAVANDTRATQEQVNNAITQLNNAIAIYKAAQKSYVGDKNTLTSLINSVQYVSVSWSGSNQYYNTAWTTQAEKDALVNAVSSARNVANNYYASQYEITNAINNLNNAITTYKNAQKYGNNGYNGYNGDQSSLQSLINSVQSIYVTTSWDGSGISYNTPWTTQAERTALENAVSSAQNVANNYYASQYEITNAINNLNNAISTYKNSIRNNYYGNGYNGDKSSLQSLILSVIYVDVSNNYGYGLASHVAWTTQAERTAIENAVSSAQNVMNNSNATQNDISYAYSNLSNAISAYQKAQKQGYHGW
ncbi:S-layer protein [Lysinibacillus sp. NPDC096418]|uniref:S-layer protein n=1 Tax=Lysinibacillus sp. NPDC096418 TaxID=3364138 RepID=UPI0037F1A6AE